MKKLEVENFVTHSLQFRFRWDIRIFKKNSAVCIPLRSQTRRCALFREVRLRGVHPTVESSFSVCIIPRSLTPRYASHSGVNNLSSVWFNPKFHKCYFSVMPKDIHTKLILSVTNCPIKSFLVQKFFKKMKSKDVASTKNTKNNGHFWKSLTPWCASHRGVRLPRVHCASHHWVKLRGVLPTAESSSAVCITLRSQNAHRGVKMQTAESKSKSLRVSGGSVIFL